MRLFQEDLVDFHQTMLADIEKNYGYDQSSLSNYQFSLGMFENQVVCELSTFQIVRPENHPMVAGWLYKINDQGAILETQVDIRNEGEVDVSIEENSLATREISDESLEKIETAFKFLYGKVLLFSKEQGVQINGARLPLEVIEQEQGTRALIKPFFSDVCAFDFYISESGQVIKNYGL